MADVSAIGSTMIPPMLRAGYRLILTALLFILLGAVLEGLPAVVILLPTFMPVVTRLGIDVIHYSTGVVAATGIGLFLPPIGVGFFIACGIANIPAIGPPAR